MTEALRGPGRPKGAITSDPVVGQAFGSSVRAARRQRGLAQEELALKAGVERSHMGKIERGEHLPTVVLALKIAKALGVPLSDLIRQTEERLPASYLP